MKHGEQTQEVMNINLNNGTSMPAVGIGTFLMQPDEAEAAVRTALQSGYRLVDTANAYLNEKAVGRAIRTSGRDRGDIFLSTKLWPSVYGAADKAIDETLERLGTDYIDLLFLHQPVGDYMGAYQAMEQETSDPEAKKYLREKIAEAKNVSQSIRQRSSTLSLVLRVIVEVQKDFFLRGPGNKRPLKLSEIASRVDLSESTVSRALHSKHVQCRWGVYPLNYFLTSTAAASELSGEAQTAEQIKAAIKGIIDGEDKKKPLSDGAICSLLEKQDIKISRRTVNKYRQEMQIPDKAGRKAWG